MKKLAKLLTLLLLAVTILTAFTVVALAEEETETVPTREKPFVFINFTYENDEVGSRNYEANHGTSNGKTYTGQGYFGVDQSIYGNKPNKYMKVYSEAMVQQEKLDATTGEITKSNVNASYHSKLGYDSNSTYTIDKYPYVAIDLDIMKTNVDYNLGSFTSYMSYKKGSKNLYPSVSVSDFKSALSSETYDWSHVTIVFEYWSDENGHYIASYVYVNGEYVTSNSKNKTISPPAGYEATDYFHGEFRFAASTTNDTAGNSTSAYDNVRITYYSSDYALSEVVGYHYNESYEMPYGKTVATIGDVQYDDLDKAIAAANEGDTIVLTEAPKAAVTVNKSIIINAGEYELEYSSTEGYTATVEDGIYTFSKSANTVTVKWDPACGTDCDCYPQVGGHIMTSETIVALDGILSYDKELPSFETVDGLEILFLGWSYENDGTVDELVAVTAEDVAKGEITLYPVYKITQYSYELISSNGESKFFLESDFTAAFKAATSGSTMLLHTDVIITEAITTSVDFTFDLNGYDLNNYRYTITQYNATLGEDGEYVKGDSAGTLSSSASQNYTFYMTKNGFTFNLKSSRPGSTVTSGKVTADQWIYGDEVVKTENAKISNYYGLFSFYPSQATYNIYGENISFYCGTLFYGEHGSNNAKTQVNVYGGTYVILGSPGEGAIALRRGGTHTFNDAKFIVNGATFIKSTRDTSTHFVFNNCDLQNAPIYLVGTTNSVTYNNCRVDGAINSSTTAEVILGEDTRISTRFSKSYANLSLAKNLRIESISVDSSFKYDRWTINSSSATPPYEFKSTSIAVTFVGEVFNLDTDYSTVTWLDLNGEKVNETLALKNKTAIAPAVELPIGDGFRAITNPIWLDGDGNASDLLIGDASAYTFKAQLPAEADRTYTEYMTGALFNMTYFAHFGYNLYVPIVEGVTYTSIGGKTEYGTVIINGQKYYVVNVGYPNSTNALNDEVKYVTYIIDGQEYVAKFRLNALLYAEIVIADKTSSAIEKEAVGCLVRYIEESYKLIAGGNALDDAIQAKFDSFYESYVPAEYATEYPDAKVVDEAAVGGLIESIHFALYDSRVSLVVTLTDEAVAAGYKVYVTGIAYDFMNTAESGANAGKVWYTNNTPLTTHVMVNYKITLYEADGKTVVSRDINGDGSLVKATTDYSLATYIVGTSNDLAKSLYAFGKAVIAVRETLY